MKTCNLTGLVCGLGYSFLLMIGSIQAQNSQGPLSGSLFSNDTTVGNVAWMVPGNAATSDNLQTSVAALLIGSPSNYLVVKGFGFNIPSTATVTGISISIEKHHSGLLSTSADNAIRIVKNGTITGSDHAVGINWPSTDSITYYGGNGDAWGTTWLPADINSGNFGVAISVNFFGTLAATAMIDHVSITVFYQELILPIELTSFDAMPGNNTVDFTWVTASETNNDFFTIESSDDGELWHNISYVQGAGNSNSTLYYEHTEHTAYIQNYYRLKQTDYDGNFTYSAIITIDRTTIPDPVAIYPNPAREQVAIDLSNASKEYSIVLLNTSGQSVSLASQTLMQGSNNLIQLSHIPSGIYFINLTDQYGNSTVTQLLHE